MSEMGEVLRLPTQIIKDKKFTVSTKLLILFVSVPTGIILIISDMIPSNPIKRFIDYITYSMDRTYKARFGVRTLQSIRGVKNLKHEYIAELGDTHIESYEE